MEFQEFVRTLADHSGLGARVKHGVQRLGVVERLGQLVPGALFVLASAPRVSAQSSVAVEAKRDPPDGLGYPPCPLNDVDGDGCADFAIDDGCDIAWVISGKTAKVLATVQALDVRGTDAVRQVQLVRTPR